MLLRLALAAVLLVPQLASVAHALEVARAEANHPLFTASGEGYASSRGHKHHDEQECRQCVRPPQAAIPQSPAPHATPVVAAPRRDFSNFSVAVSVGLHPPRGPPHP